MVKKYSINQKKGEHREIKNKWEIYTMDYYSSIKKNTVEPVLMR